MGKLEPYRKSLVAAVGAIIAFASLVVASDVSDITSSEWIAGAVMLATALGVYEVPNRDHY